MLILLGIICVLVGMVFCGCFCVRMFISFIVLCEDKSLFSGAVGLVTVLTDSWVRVNHELLGERW